MGQGKRIKNFFLTQLATQNSIYVLWFYSITVCLKPCTFCQPPRVKSGIFTG